MITLFPGLTGKQAETYGLVLSALGICHRIKRQAHTWEISVPAADSEKARMAVEAYRQENQDRFRPSRDVFHRFTGTWTGLWVAALLLAVHVTVATRQIHEPFIRFYGASARHILDGALYRCVTALLIHADAVHLVGNMAGIALFGTAVCSLTGWGAGWLMILLSGSAGNFLNAFLFETGHISIGASTAVFGALGILSGHQFVGKYRLPGQRLKALLPLGGGVALLGLLGSAAHSDITAHMFGFLCGTGMGACWALWIRQPPPEKYQIGSACIAVLILLLSWMP
ncbi:MAG: hypothetical protein DRH32_02240 [Deltaproteobacteria bacterium]|nr:MAG: hypothetical protein DRH32_02240 [Deltaproteobacteria bacterium]